MNRGSSDRATSRTARLALGPAVALALLALAGCDSGGSTPPQPSPVADSGTPSVTMTGVTEAARCSEHRELGRGGDAKLPFADGPAPELHEFDLRGFLVYSTEQIVS